MPARVHTGRGYHTGLPFLVIALVALTAMSLHRTLAKSIDYAHQAQSSLRRFERLMQISTSAVVLLRQGRIEDSNYRLEDMFGTTRDSLRGTCIDALFAEDDRASALLHAGPTLLHKVGIRSDGSHFQAEVSVLDLEDGEFLAEIRDVTRQKHVEEKLTLLASIDPLTGALNRRAFLERYDQPRSILPPYCLAILDLDHFKRINDGFGHSVGDAVLKAFAEVNRSSARRGDLFARFGGEEFVLLLQDCPLENACLLMGQLRHSLAAEPFAGVPGSVTISFSAGLVECSTWITLHTVLLAADELLYKAKAGGRNRVEGARL